MADMRAWIAWLGGGARRALGTVATLVVVLAVIAVGEALPPMRALDAFLKGHPGVEQALLWLTIGMSVVGTLLLALSQFLPGPRLPKGMTREEAEAQSPPVAYREEIEKVEGPPERRWGRSFSGGASLGAVKQAWQARSWRYDRRWRLLFAMALGAALLLFGLFGLFIVIGQPGVKFLMLLALAYAVARTAWALWRA
jgi:type VI protein secretion system component VasK